MIGPVCQKGDPAALGSHGKPPRRPRAGLHGLLAAWWSLGGGALSQCNHNCPVVSTLNAPAQQGATKGAKTGAAHGGRFCRVAAEVELTIYQNTRLVSALAPHRRASPRGPAFQ
jgi:hypothetical protein